MIGKIDCPDQLAQGWNLYQAGFFHSDLGGSTNVKCSLTLMTPPNMLPYPIQYAEIPKQPWNPILASVNPVILKFTRRQPEQPDKPEDWVYGSKSEVWPYGLFPGGNISTKVRVSCVYNSTQWGVFQLTINDLYTLWDVPLLLQEKLEELDKNPCWFNFCHQFRGKH